MITIYKGNTPLITFTFKKKNGTVPTGLPSSASKYVVRIHDSASVRDGGGNVGNVNITEGTCTYQTVAADTANACQATWWVDVDLGETVKRTFDPQKLLIQDPVLV